MVIRIKAILFVDLSAVTVQHLQQYSAPCIVVGHQEVGYCSNVAWVGILGERVRGRLARRVGERDEDRLLLFLIFPRRFK